MELLEQISEHLQKGKAKEVRELVQQAVDEGIPSQIILEEGLLSGMGIISEKFKRNEVFVPEVLVAARAMSQGAALLKPLLIADGVKARGRVNCQVICCSTLLVATMGVMEEVVKAAEAAGIRDSVKIMVGGAPVTEDFCRQIGADAYTPDAVTAAELAVQFCA